MSSADKNLSDLEITGQIPNAKDMIFVVVVSEWNHEITGALEQGCIELLKKQGALPEHIMLSRVPGTFELPLAAGWMIQHRNPDAVICLGCVVQGETPHFDFICDATANGIMNLGLKYGIPVIFGVITTLNMEQARDRSGGKHGNKGEEAAATAIRMVALAKKMRV